MFTHFKAMVFQEEKRTWPLTQDPVNLLFSSSFVGFRPQVRVCGKINHKFILKI